MNIPSALRAGLAKVFVYTLLALFLIPTVAYVFTGHAQREQDARFVAGISQRIDAARDMTADGKQELKDYYRANPPSTICGSTDPDAREYRDALCQRYSEVWQFTLARKTAFWTLVGGAVLLAAVLGLGALAFANRTLQYASFVTGWRLTTFASAAALVVQGALAVWMSFWVTAFFFHKYSPKLVIIVGLAVAVGVFVAVAGIFKRVQADSHAVGELVSEADAPLLWKRIRHMAERLKTEPPRHIVAGIDANFFVTEAPLTVGDRTLTGRTLFVSLPLLRILDQSEADAVFGHELAHLRGGDTRSSARLGPKLVQFDDYRDAMRAGGLTAVVSPLLDLYRTIFEIALARDSREREFKADRVAAKLVSPAAIAQSLVKIAAYAQYRAKIEDELFGQDRRHDAALGIARFVSQGLAPYAASDDFLDAMKTANVPHPFDSHPAMPERMRNVGVALPESDYGAIAVRAPVATWVQEILTADAIEQRLWSDYEQQFAQDHERSLAYRYEPANEEERALVLKYFPPVVFALKGGRTAEVGIDGISTSAGGATVPWDAVKVLQFKESSFFGDALVVTHPEKGMLGAKTTKIALPGLKKDKGRFNATVEHYWQRHQIMRVQQQAG